MGFVEQQLLFWGCITFVPILAAVGLHVWAVRRKTWKLFREGLISLILFILGLGGLPPFLSVLNWFLYPQHH